ncbi:putative manganese exporter [compost metagenome]
MLSWVLAASFLAVAAWTLIPDKLDDDEEGGLKKYGPFLTTLIAFFIAEMGDKTQIATVMLAAQYEYFWLVIAGTTLGMMIANVPVVLAAHFSADKLPMTLIHRISALCFVALALYAAWNAAKLSGWLG